MNKTSLAALFSLLALSPITLLAQDLGGERYWVTGRVTTGIDIVFDNVGTIPFDSGRSGDVEFDFADGFVDFPELPDNATADFTSDFGFEFANAELDEDGFVESFTLERFNAVSNGTQIDSEIGRLGGWEGGYSIPVWRITPRLTLRAEAGMAVVGIDTDGNQEIEAQFFRQIATVTVPEGVIPGQDGGIYINPGEDGPLLTRDDVQTGDLSPVEQFLPGETEPTTIPADIALTYDVSGIYANLSAGAHLEWFITRDLLLDVRAGFTGGYFSADLLVGQSINNTTLGAPVFLPERESVQDWLPGYYVDFGVSYNVNRQVSAFAAYRITRTQDVGRVFFNNFSSKVSASNTKSVRAGMNFTY